MVRTYSQYHVGIIFNSRKWFPARNDKLSINCENTLPLNLNIFQNKPHPAKIFANKLWLYIFNKSFIKTKFHFIIWNVLFSFKLLILLNILISFLLIDYPSYYVIASKALSIILKYTYHILYLVLLESLLLNFINKVKNNGFYFLNVTVVNTKNHKTCFASWLSKPHYSVPSKSILFSWNLVFPIH